MIYTIFNRYGHVPFLVARSDSACATEKVLSGRLGCFCSTLSSGIKEKMYPWKLASVGGAQAHVNSRALLFSFLVMMYSVDCHLELK